MPADTLLFEIGTEELPPKSLKSLMQALEENLQKQLRQAGLSFSASRAFATPRRMAVEVTDLADQQAAQAIERRGPSVKAAFDESGAPTKALIGFARSCGVEDPGELERIASDKGEWMVYRDNREGQNLSELIEGIIERSLADLPIERRMRWGASRMEFVRPVHWVVLMYGTEVLPAVVLGQTSGRLTRGHRFMSSGEVEIASADQYLGTLEKASVIADFEKRRETIITQIEDLAEDLKGQLQVDAALLDEVTSLVEWPRALAGDFDKSFLDVPEEALISAMKEHQRYFHLTNEQGKLLPCFITVSNIESKDPSAVVAGNERVIRPRLSDASFFYKKDAATTMDEKLNRLKSVVFQSELGTFYDKAARISSLAKFLSAEAGADETAAARAGLICKSDLVSEMVGEFPDLQGIMGGYYAEKCGEPAEVCLAIREHYLPISSGGRLPSSDIASIVALADKIDTVVGLFSIGQPPTGSRDPYALRRQSLGITRICIENQIDIDLGEALDHAAGLYKSEFSTEGVKDYILDRLSGWYTEQNVPLDVFNAVRNSAAGITSLLEADGRIRSVQQFREHELAPGLIAANKRVSNILKKLDVKTGSIDPALFCETAESRLAEQIHLVQEAFTTGQNSYKEKFEKLADLQVFIDQYFDDVMVMSEDQALQHNRLMMLLALRSLFLEVADFSLLQT